MTRLFPLADHSQNDVVACSSLEWRIKEAAVEPSVPDGENHLRVFHVAERELPCDVLAGRGHPLRGARYPPGSAVEHYSPV